MKHLTSRTASSLRKTFCIIMTCFASLVAFGQQPFEGKIVYSVNTTSRGIYKLITDIQGTSEEVVYISGNKYILFNVATQLVNFIDLEADAIYVACPPIKKAHKSSASELIQNTEEILNKGGHLVKLAQWHHSLDLESLVDGYPARKYSVDTIFDVPNANYKVTYNASEVCLKDFLSPELAKVYTYFYGMPYYEHTSDVKQDCPAPLLKSVRYQTREVKTIEEFTPDASVFTIPSDLEIVSQRDFSKAYEKYTKKLNKEREKAGTSVEYSAPEDVWDF